VNNLVAAVIVEVMIGLSSRLRAHKARAVDILAGVVVSAIKVTIYPYNDDTRTKTKQQSRGGRE